MADQDHRLAVAALQLLAQLACQGAPAVIDREARIVGMDGKARTS
jgi:hypothetical protein